MRGLLTHLVYRNIGYQYFRTVIIGTYFRDSWSWGNRTVATVTGPVPEPTVFGTAPVSGSSRWASTPRTCEAVLPSAPRRKSRPPGDGSRPVRHRQPMCLALRLEDAGVSIGLVHHDFDSKPGLIRVVDDHVVAVITAARADPLPGTPVSLLGIRWYVGHRAMDKVHGTPRGQVIDHGRHLRLVLGRRPVGDVAVNGTTHADGSRGVMGDPK